MNESFCNEIAQKYNHEEAKEINPGCFQCLIGHDSDNTCMTLIRDGNIKEEIKRKESNE